MNKTIRLFFVLSTTAIFFLGACSKIVYTQVVEFLVQNPEKQRPPRGGFCLSAS